MKPQIFTHRGLEPASPNFYLESTYEAFLDHLHRGFCLEVDLNFTLNGIVFFHDTNLKRLTNGKDERALKTLMSEEVCSTVLPAGRIGTFEEIMESLFDYPQQSIAVHFKGCYQTDDHLRHFIDRMKPFENLHSQVLVFDLKPDSAQSIRKHFPSLALAASVAHPYDVERYQLAVNGTLLTLDQFLSFQDLYTWAWLDEWDLTDKPPSPGKKLYSKAVFDALRSKDIRIALVTPELHGTSPGLLGGESHPDAKDRQTLMRRIEEILLLKPDAVCTDYPVEVSRLLQTLSEKFAN